MPSSVEIDKSPVVQMSASSIAQVCQINRSQVLEILKEIFMKFIDMSKNQQEIVLDFKIGDL